jgi:glycine cleavage system aminomethyltransferase T
MGNEPVFLDGKPVGYVTSAAFGHTVRAPVAYAWLPSSAEDATRIEIQYFDRRIAATVAAEPLVDPEMTRIRA